MRRWKLPPSQWRRLPVADRLEILAADQLLDEQRLRLLEQVRGLADESGLASVLGQILILALAD